jgi:hypothetical protein
VDRIPTGGRGAIIDNLVPDVVVALSFFGSWVALSCAFGAPVKGDGPLAVPLTI